MLTLSGGATYLDDTTLTINSASLTRVSVPDSGMSLVLLGLGLTALGVFARFRKQVAEATAASRSGLSSMHLPKRADLKD